MSLPPGPSRIAVPDDPRDLPGTFCHRREVDVRFADTDAMGHVNNAVYLTYCESARISYWTDVTGEPGWVTRLAEMGVRIGSRLLVLQAGSPCLLQVGECRLCLRGEMVA